MLGSSDSKSQKFLKYFILLFIPIIFYQSIISAQEKGNADSTLIHKSGAHAFEFYLLNEQSISYKRYVSDNWLVKFNFDVSGMIGINSRKGTSFSTISENYEFDYDEDYNTTWIGFSTQILNHFIKNKYLNIIIGIGPTFKYGQNEKNTEILTSDKDNNKFNQYQNIFGATATVFLEINIHKSVFLLGKYEIKAEYLEFEVQRVRYNKNEIFFDDSEETYLWELYTSKLELGLSIYF